MLLAALAGRLVLALWVFPGEGFASDLGYFQRWATEMFTAGPSQIYTTDAQINYPPGYLLVLGVLGWASRTLHPAFGAEYADTLASLLKVPAVVADVGTGWLVYGLANRMRGHAAGMVAAALVLFLPLTWYDSAVWGQADAVSGFFMVASLTLLIHRRDVGACVVAAGALLMKPQAVVVVVIVLAVLVRRHLIHRSRPWVLVAGPAAGLATVTIVAGPFDISLFAPQAVQTIPVLSQVCGLYGLFMGATNSAAVLTANAYNGWALVGPRPLDQRAGGFDLNAWTPDSIPVLWGISAFSLGVVLLSATALLVLGGLLMRDDDSAILLGFTILAVAFFAVPTRVHERYMFPAYLTGAVLASPGLVRAGAYLVSNLLTTVNLHGVLSAAFGSIIGSSESQGAGLAPPAQPGRGLGGAPSTAISGGTSAQLPSGSALPWRSFGRAPWLVDTIAVAHSLTFVVLVVVWLAHLRRSREPSAQARAPSALTRDTGVR